MSEQERKIFVEAQMQEFWKFVTVMGQAHNERQKNLSNLSPEDTGYLIPASLNDYTYTFLTRLESLVSKL